MKKVIGFFAVVLLVTAVSSSYAGSILFKDDFESQPLGGPYSWNNPNVSWVPWGIDAAGPNVAQRELYMLQENGNKFARIAWYGFGAETGTSTTPGVVLMYEDPPGQSLYDLSDALSISFRIRSNLADSLQLISPYFVDSDDTIVRLEDSALLFTPTDVDGWVEYSVNMSDMTFGADTIDLSQIVQVNIGFFQKDGSSTDLIGAGIFDIDDFEVAVPEPLSLFLLGSAVLGLFRFRKKD